MPVWHASVALLGPDMLPLRLWEWRPSDWDHATQALDRALAGVGDHSKPDHVETTTSTVQRRRPISGEEFRIIGPAVDLRGTVLPGRSGR